MLRLVTAENKTEFISVCQREPLFGTQMLCMWYAHQDNWQQFTAWIGFDGALRLRYALCRYGNQYLLCAAQKLNRFCREELGSFLCMEQTLHLEGALPHLQQLMQQLRENNWCFPLSIESFPILCHNKPCLRKTPPGSQIVVSAEYSALFSLIQQEHNISRDRWLACMFPQFRQGICQAFVLEDCQSPAACGFLSSVSESDFAIITNLITRRSLQGQGLGSCVVTQLCEEAYRQQKTPYLICGQTSLTKFYFPLGFTLVGWRGLLKGNPK